MTQQAEPSGWDVATRLEHSHGGVPCVATAEIRRLQAENEALRTALAQQGYKPSCLHGDDDYCKACYMQEATAASPEVIPVRTNIKNQIFMDISSPQPLTYDDLTAIVQGVVSNSERPIGMVAYGVLVARAIERAHGIGGAP